MASAQNQRNKEEEGGTPKLPCPPPQPMVRHAATRCSQASYISHLYNLSLSDASSTFGSWDTSDGKLENKHSVHHENDHPEMVCPACPAQWPPPMAWPHRLAHGPSLDREVTRRLWSCPTFNARAGCFAVA